MDVRNLITALNSVGGSNATSSPDGLQRLALIDAARRALHRLQTPFERVWEMTLAEPHVYAAIKTTSDLGLWKAWGGVEDARQSVSKSLDELVALCNQAGGCDANLLRRLLRISARHEVVEETGADMFMRTPFAKALAGENMYLAVRCGESNFMPMALNIPSYLASIQYKDPTDAESTAYLTMPTNPEHLSLFARCRWRPEYQNDFVASMSGITEWKEDWTDYFDTQHLVAGHRDGALFVDVGGNAGVDVMRFLKKHPNSQEGSLILQDVPDVVEIAKKQIDHKVQAVAYDFFTPQPVLSSRIYFFHSILHDWPDNLALDIPANVRAAFCPGYSRLVIAEVVVPPVGASIMQATHDLCLMGLLSARERTESDWRVLLDKAGFEVVGVFPDAQGVESVIEAELKEEGGGEGAEEKDKEIVK